MLDTGAAETLGITFQKLKAQAEHTSEMMQFHNIWDTCLPLVRAMGFKDGVARAHQMFLTRAFRQTLPFEPEQAAPSTKIMAEVIVYLMELSVDRGRGRSFFNMGFEAPHGFTYSAEDSPPVTLDLQIQCGPGGVDLLAFLCGWSLPDRQEIGDLIYSIARDLVEGFAGGGYQSLEQGYGPMPYITLYYEGALARLHTTLILLGLPNQLRYLEGWRESHFKLNPAYDESESTADCQWRMHIGLFSTMKMASHLPFSQTNCCPRNCRICVQKSWKDHPFVSADNFREPS
ncbi:hypothetical protein B0T14DRAFT_571620 [Immersiella caudata]|uniref:Uncharacterized protein n=1 Tax=Immersiella caudata TaxID=314043 RepID=A0AA39WAE9_9PEZI|nr:hypothetical protein B0T14DRAFT_571620 [Immersiella caudata]